ncbi:uncharacterized protein F5891DRAFT_1258773 [Suillus fuscotomentosus]|uniref:Uncharacterized protein n=1 Tax=Suillus fuscotomentosus TaxID=1912939 RepID=A0AAD4HFG2_9AGAM|nr:uncharacterized protein F5891DRAFT_1258773 [Suillus fuscotomentosus]KAG1893534.1 hypothetical protein F5891DRAFT_1258773 [Suillus fuscotomentosus]
MKIFDFAAHHRALKENLNYAINAKILQRAEWRHGGSGHILTDKDSDEPFIGIAVMHIVDFRLQCSPIGSFLGSKYGGMEKAKYQFIGGRTHGKDGFDEDFARTHALLNNIQNAIAVSHNKKDMLLDEQSVRFARNIFEKRVSLTNSTVRLFKAYLYNHKEHAVPDSPTASRRTVYLEDLENPHGSHTIGTGEELKMDDETANWPVDSQYSDDLATIKAFYKAVPLRVYDENNKFVEPENVNKALCNAIAEIHFTLHHLYLPKNLPPQDSFRANIEQILILQRGKTTTSIYTSDPHAGPASTTKATHHTPPPTEAPPSKRLHTEEQTVTKGKEKEHD